MVNKRDIKTYLDICVVCGEETGNILLTNAVNDNEFQKYLCNGNLCEECKKHVEKGEIGIIKTCLSSTGEIKLAGMSIFITSKFAKQICNENQIKNGFALCDEQTWDELFGNIEKIEDNGINNSSKAES